MRTSSTPDGEASEADLVGGDAEAGVSIEALALFDGFPTFFGRREVPLAAAPTDDPETAALGIERESAANGKVLDGVVRLERGVAEDAGGVHPSTNMAYGSGVSHQLTLTTTAGGR